MHGERCLRLIPVYLTGILVLSLFPELLRGQTADTYTGGSVGSDGFVHGYSVTEGTMASTNCCTHTYTTRVSISGPTNGTFGVTQTLSAPSNQYASVRADDSLALTDGGAYVVYGQGSATCSEVGSFFSSPQQTVSVLVHVTNYTYSSDTVENFGGCGSCRVCIMGVSCSPGTSAVCHNYNYTWAVSASSSCPGTLRVFFTSSCSDIWVTSQEAAVQGTCY